MVSLIEVPSALGLPPQLQARHLLPGATLAEKNANRDAGDKEKQRQKAAWEALQAANLDDDEET